MMADAGGKLKHDPFVQILYAGFFTLPVKAGSYLKRGDGGT